MTHLQVLSIRFLTLIVRESLCSHRDRQHQCNDFSPT